MVLDILHFKDWPVGQFLDWLEKFCIGAWYLNSCFKGISQLYLGTGIMIQYLSYLSSKLKIKLLIIPVKYFIPRIFFRQRMWNDPVPIFSYLDLRWGMIIWLKRRKSLFLFGNEDYRSLFSLHETFEKGDFFTASFAKGKIPFWFQCSNIILGTDYFTSHLVILVQKR